MKVTIASDIHNDFRLLNKIINQEKDMLIISGDLTNTGRLKDIEDILKEITKDKAKYKIVVFGNHDVQAEFEIPILKNKYQDITFLTNEIVEIEGYKIYGTPYVRAFCFWGFQCYTIQEIQDLTIPKENVDIIISHEPPSHPLLSYLPYGEDIGNMALRKYIEDSESVKYVISGHVHENSGNKTTLNKAKAYNVAKTFKNIVLGD